MENPELANTSKKLDKKKKSKLYSDKHGGSSEQQEAFLHADTDVKPKRSFWKNLFRKIPKKSEVPEMVTDQKSAMLTSKLNAIFEEPKTPEEKEHVVEEIEDLKKTLKRISQVEAAVVEAAAVPAAVVEAAAVVDEPLLEYLSDVSSTSSGSAAAAVVAGAVPALARDGYSFEYSEASEPSLGDEDGRDNKVLTFDEKVEQKDADSNIVVRDLSPGPGPGLHEMEVGADRQEVMTGSGVILVLPAPAPDDQCQQPFKLLDSKRSSPPPPPPPPLDVVPAAANLRLLDVNTLDEPDTGCRECRLDDFFKMIFRQTADDHQVLNYAVAFDPVLSNFSVQCRQLSDNRALYSDRQQKVVRKRKRMSMLHDKTKMAEYLREMEQDEVVKQLQQQQQQQQEEEEKRCEDSVLATPGRRLGGDEHVLLVLESTRQRLQRYLDLEVDSVEAAVDSTAAAGSGGSGGSSSSSLSGGGGGGGERPEDEIDGLFHELLVNIDELKQSCIRAGAGAGAEVAHDVLDEVLERVYRDTEPPPPPGHFASPALSFVHECGSVHDMAARVSVATTPSPSATPSLALPPLPLAQARGAALLAGLRDELHAAPSHCLPDPDTHDTASQTDEPDNKDTIERSKKFGPYYERKPEEALAATLPPPSPPPRTLSPPEVTDSLQHIFFGPETSGELLASEFNLLAPQPGPSTLEVVSCGGGASVSGASTPPAPPHHRRRHDIALERKPPDTNLHIDTASIQSNLKAFRESMNQINRTNMKTVEMLTSSAFSTPDGSVSILSTIAENMLEATASKASAERYPQFIARTAATNNKDNNLN